MLWPRSKLQLNGPRITLRAPIMRDYAHWVKLRRDSQTFLAPWEPVRASDHLTKRGFRRRVMWSHRAILRKTAVPMFMFDSASGILLGAITLDTVQRGPAQMCNIGYWIGACHARRGYMREALDVMIDFAFNDLGLSRIQAGCLAENTPSRTLLEQAGFLYEGTAQNYLQIAGRWQTHVLYAKLRHDRIDSDMPRMRSE